MTRKRNPGDKVEAPLLETEGVAPNAGEDQARAASELGPEQGPQRSRRRRLIWPLTLATVLAASSLTIAHAATLPPLVPSEAMAGAFVSEAAQAPIQAALPATDASASAEPVPFGPQIEVILPPPPPPPPPAKSSSKTTTAQRKATAAAAVSAGLTPAQYCAGKYGATSSASSLQGLLAAANAERAVFGLGALSWSGTLAESAQGWSNTMAGSYTADSPTAGFTHGNAPSPGGQNIAAAWTTGSSMAQSTAIAKAHSGWMASPGHCTNILHASFTSMGAGTASSADGKAWFSTVNFQ